jgi:hypothetical protein
MRDELEVPAHAKHVTRSRDESHFGILAAMARNLLASFLALLAIHCSGSAEEPEVTSAGPTTSGGGCTGDRGTLSGTARLPKMVVGGSVDPPADGATIILTPDGGSPLQAMADADGHYEALIPAGDWQVEAQHPSNCSTNMPLDVTVTACMTVVQDLLLEACFDGG